MTVGAAAATAFEGGEPFNDYEKFYFATKESMDTKEEKKHLMCTENHVFVPKNPRCEKGKASAFHVAEKKEKKD